MKFLLSIAIALALLFPAPVLAQATVPQGGTGLNSIAADTFLMGSTTLRLQAVASSTVAALVNFWTKSGTTLYYTGGNVGIGTTTPTRPFVVAGTSMGLSSTANANIIIDRGGTDRLGSLTYQTAGVNSWFSGVTDSDILGNGTEYFISTSSSLPRFVITTAGNIGIGTVAPAYLLNPTSSDGINVFGLSSTANNQPYTNFAPANTFFTVRTNSSGSGSLISGLTDDDQTAMTFRANIGVSDPTDSTPALIFAGSKSNGGTGKTALGALETVLQFQNDTTALVSLLGSGNFGIGTVSPSTLLHLSQTPGSLAATPTLSFGDGDTGFYESADNVLRVSLGGTNYFTFQTTRFTAQNGAAVSNSVSSATTPVFIPTTGALTAGLGGSGGDLSLITAGVSRLYATAAGNIGIGNTGPAQKLDVTGYAQASLGFLPGTSSDLRLIRAASGTLLVDSFGSGGTAIRLGYSPTVYSTWQMTDTTAGNLTLSTTGGSSGHILLSPLGNVGIGTTTPGSLLTVAGTTTASCFSNDGGATCITGGGGSVWGAITGTLSDQTDLQAALDAKAATTTSNTWGGTQTFTNTPVLGALTGVVKAVSGVLSAGLVDLATEITGILGIANGGTNISTYTTGDILFATTTDTLAKLPIGSTGDVLTVAGGKPAWVAPGGGGGVEVQTFTSSGTWTKPAGLQFVIVWAWGGGGSGGGDSGAGGGGGACSVRTILAASLGATETVTIGAGGASVASTVGNQGGTSSFGSHISAYGGGGGGRTSNSGGGGGGGALGAGANGSSTGGAGGGPAGGAGGNTTGGGTSSFGGGGGSDASTPTGDSAYGGAGGGFVNGAGANSAFGGAGGGGVNDRAGGTSAYAGSGGNGGNSSAGFAGGFPSGGGGGGSSGFASGAGGAGVVVVYEYF